MISAAMSASMNSIAWNATIGLPNCRRSSANASDRSSARVDGAHRARADHQPLLDEPVLRELVALADLAEHADRRRPARRRTRRSDARTRTCACTSACARAGRRASPCRRGTPSPSPGRRRRARAPGRSRRRRRSSRATSRRRSPSRRRRAARWSRTIVTSEPAPSSVIAYASRRSPRIAGRRYRSFCASVPRCSGIDGRHGMSQSAPVARPHCSSTSICWNRS